MLGAGFVGSGPLVLLLDAVLRTGAQPAQWQRVVLFESVAATIVAGMVAGLYLLSRSWRDLGGCDRSAELSELPFSHVKVCVRVI